MGMRFAPEAQPISRTRARGTLGGFIPNRVAIVASLSGWVSTEGRARVGDNVVTALAVTRHILLLWLQGPDNDIRSIR